MSTEKKIIIAIGAFTIILLFGGVFIFSSKESKEKSIPEELVVVRNGLHWHPRLEIYIKGENQEIPANVGVSPIHQEIHTHEDANKGILHMEMAGVVTKDETELGIFFKTWGKVFSSDQILEYKNGPGGKVKMFVNGKENYDFEKYQMKDKDIIEIRYE